MKKTVIPLATIGLFSFSVVQAQTQGNTINQFVSKNPVYFSGSLRFRQEDHQYTDLQRVRSFGQLRARMEFQVVPAEDDWSVLIQPQFSKHYGEKYFTPTTSSSNTATNSSGNAADSSVLFHQAYMNYRFFTDYSLTVGREEIGYGNEMVLGKLNWSNTGRSFDTIRARYSHGNAWSDLFYAKVVDTNTNLSTATNVGDRDLYGSYSSFSQLPFIDTIDLYLLYLHDREAVENYDVMTGGTRLVSKIRKFDYRLEMNKQANSIESSLIDGEVGYTFDDAKTFRMALGASIAEDDYEQFYPTWHSWLGHADMIGRRNVKSVVGHTSWKASDQLDLLLSYHHFWRANTNQPLYKVNTALAPWANNSRSSDVGSEVDLIANYKIKRGPQLRAGVSHFLLGDYFIEQYDNKNPWFSYLEMEVRF